MLLESWLDELKNVVELFVGVESAKNEFVTVVSLDRVVRHSHFDENLFISNVFQKFHLRTKLEQNISILTSMLEKCTLKTDPVGNRIWKSGYNFGNPHF